MALEPTQISAVAWIDANRTRLSEFNRTIWNFAEPAWREYKSARAYCDLLRAEGFTVEEGSGGMLTAFAATWGSGSPVLGSFAEYDAVPAQSCMRGCRALFLLRNGDFVCAAPGRILVIYSPS